MLLLKFVTVPCELGPARADNTLETTALPPGLANRGTDYRPVKLITLATADEGCLLKVTHTCCKALLREQSPIAVLWLNK